MIKTGLETLWEKRLYKRERIGVVTNHSAITGRGTPIWDLLLDGDYRVTAFFGPEHGFHGAVQDAKKVGDSLYRGVPVYSLYGESLRPSREMLLGIDRIVFDIQDVGCRYYTYLYTLAYLMEECEKEKISVSVLDRPNPLGGVAVEGTPIEAEYDSFVGGYALCHRYGLTVGEYALYLKENYTPQVDLDVVKMEGYSRNMTFRETGFPWLPPSPNMPSISTAYAYPGSCFIEGTELSEGRGTTFPFLTVGAPWLKSRELRSFLKEKKLEGVVFSEVSYTPLFSKFKGQVCQGIRLSITDYQNFRPLYTGIHLLCSLKELFPNHFSWKADYEERGSYFIDKLAGTPLLRESVDRQQEPESIYKELTENQDSFTKERSRFFLYQ